MRWRPLAVSVATVRRGSPFKGVRSVEEDVEERRGPHPRPLVANWATKSQGGAATLSGGSRDTGASSSSQQGWWLPVLSGGCANYFTD